MTNYITKYLKRDNPQLKKTMVGYNFEGEVNMLNQYSYILIEFHNFFGVGVFFSVGVKQF